MRARNIKPGFFRNEKIADLPYPAKILFIGLWCLADRNGMIERRPRKIAAEIFPYEPETASTVNSLLDHLEQSGFIRYLTDGQSDFVYVENFLKHQSPHHTEKESGLPLPENCVNWSASGSHGELSVTSRSMDGENPSDSLIPDSLITDSLIPDSSAVADDDGTKAGSESYAPYLDAWNRICGHIQKATKLSTQRKKHLRARINEPIFRDNYESILAKIAASDFCSGKNDRSWKADFDWLIANDSNYVKAYEGKYDNKGTTKPEPIKYPRL